MVLIMKLCEDCPLNQKCKEFDCALKCIKKLQSQIWLLVGKIQ
jgi:hypothetical protein